MHTRNCHLPGWGRFPRLVPLTDCNKDQGRSLHWPTVCLFSHTGLNPGFPGEENTHGHGCDQSWPWGRSSLTLESPGPTKTASLWLVLSLNCPSKDPSEGRQGQSLPTDGETTQCMKEGAQSHRPAVGSDVSPCPSASQGPLVSKRPTLPPMT